MNLKPLLHSSSLILFHQSHTLMIRRTGSISFPNTYVFPGGVCQDSDKQYHHKFCQYSKITVLRQTLEQTGLLILPPSINEKQFLQMTFEDVLKQIVRIWKDDMNLIIPVFRIMTVQIPIKRFDCIFFTIDSSVKIVNFKGSKMDKSLTYNLQKLIINGQSLKYQWNSPSQFLKKNEKKELDLPPPQIIILSALSRLSDQISINKINYIDAIQPIIFDLHQINKGLWLLPGDKDYNYSLILQNQPKSQSQLQLIQYFKTKQKQTKRIRRISLQKNILSFYASQPEYHLLTYLPQQPNL